MVVPEYGKVFFCIQVDTSVNCGWVKVIGLEVSELNYQVWLRIFYPLVVSSSDHVQTHNLVIDGTHLDVA